MTNKVTRELPAVLLPPDELSDAAKGKWRELADALSRVCRHPSDFERDMLRVYVDAWCVREQAVAALRAGDLLAVSTNRTRYPNPVFKIIDQAEKTMDRVYRRLRLADTHTGGNDLDAVDAELLGM